MKKIKKEELIIKNEEAEAIKNQLARTLADYDNLVKRVERERDEVKKVLSLRLILKLLSVLDGLENAQEHLKDQGLAITIIEFKKVLNEEGLTEIKSSVGNEFDENTMEAVEVVPGKSDNTVASTALVGYKFSDGTVVRHARVVVTKSEARNTKSEV
ncbi:MAG TPA: nucleotide exchange factor GrpE [Patescibacteria group bacterium]|nr:nucleotide exchange factor GrpE [Patescibacteria group bacterium]